jgi:glycosyltransferase involved in cell wall biosynthesis
MAPLRVSVVTPCRNAAATIERTAASVLAQTAVRSGRVELEYVVVDGASTDGTAERARRLCGGAAEIVSEPDRGMYDALAKGLRRATGDVVAYLNAGDAYHPAAFEVVADLFSRPDVSWLTGMRVLCNEREEVVGAWLPPPYLGSFLRKGLYDGRLVPFVQQESTFWRRALHAELDLEELATYRLAGDAWLWSRFARAADLCVVESFLGAFSVQPGQLSERIEEYRREMARFALPASPAERLRAALLRHGHLLPVTLKQRLPGGRLFRYGWEERRWG